jgi:hypothetical protein
MRKTKITVYCDACGRDVKSVHYNGDTGQGKITLAAKTHDGQSSLEVLIDDNDLCLSCARQVQDTIEEIKQDHNVG